jgi:hypothetical protein
MQNLEIKKPFFELPLTGNYQLIFPNGETWQATSDEVLELLNDQKEFPENRAELRFGFRVSNGVLVKEIL